MGLINKLVSSKPSENSGSRSGNRFDFQRDWALVKILELHENNNDYIVILDYHDDILILDSETDPKNINFYQLKTRSKNITVNTLIERKKSKQADQIINSILGKLYINKINFGDSTLGLYLVSNMPFKIKLIDASADKATSYDIIPLKNLHEDEKKIIQQALNEEFGVNYNDIFDLTTLMKTPLSLQEHSEHAQGKVISFLKKTNNENIRPERFYELLYSLIRDASNYESYIESDEQLLSKKCVKKSQVIQIMERLRTKENGKWVKIESELNHCSLTIFEKKRVKMGFQSVEMEFMGRPKTILQTLKESIRHLIIKYENRCYNCMELVTCILKEIKDNPIIPLEVLSLYDEYFMKALILIDYIDYLEDDTFGHVEDII